MKVSTHALVSILGAFILFGCGGGGGDGGGTSAPTPPSTPTLGTGPAACVGAAASSFPCMQISLRTRVPFASMGGSQGNDIWGWFDAETNHEYALVGMTNGTAFVDITDPDTPVYMGGLPTATNTTVWRDIKVYQDHAFIVADAAGSHGMQVFDLRRLRAATSPQTYSVDARYLAFGSAHNIAINEATGFAYVVGSDTCNGGLHIIDIRTPNAPQFAGCYADTETHDTQCVVYGGPDVSHRGREVCFSSNEDHVEIVDVTDKAMPFPIASLTYSELGFVHQGWLTEDHRYLLIGDELDELNFNVRTRTHIIDVSDLDAPAYLRAYEADTPSTDHNLYVLGDRVFEANYSSGLRVLEIGDLAVDSLNEIAFFDTFPNNDDASFDGAWSVYPYLPSGTVIANDRINGLFVLSLDVLTALAGANLSSAEREAVQLTGRRTGSAATSSVVWTQTRGTPATLISPSQLVTELILPSVSVSETLSFELRITDVAGATATDTVDVFVNAYANLSEIAVSDPPLQQCIDDIAANGGMEDTGLLATLTCPGVSSLAGLPALPQLTNLALPTNALDALDYFASLPLLQSLDLRGNPALPCDALTQLEMALDPGVTLQIDDECRHTVMLDLAAAGFDTTVDEARRQVYVSVPERNEIIVVSLGELRIIDRITLPGSPRGIALSLDGTRLFAALYNGNAVAVLNLDTRDVSTIDLADRSRDARTWDVIEGAPDRLFVTSNPSSNGLAHVVQVRLDQGNVVSRVANEQFIRAQPVLERSSDSQFVYVGEGFSPNSLYKLSLADPDAGIVLEDSHGSVGGSDHLAINPTGTRIALRSGQVLRTGSFIEEGRVAAGISTAAALGDTLVVNPTGTLLEFYDFDTLQLNKSIALDCPLTGAATRLNSHDGDRNFVMLHANELCVTASAQRTLPPDPFRALSFSDLALEECVRDGAQSLGLSLPEDFTTLDCSSSTKIIRSLEGIGAMVNLRQLDISNSAVFDLTPLAGLNALQTLTIRDSAITDISTLLNLPALSVIELAGNQSVLCSDLDAIAAGGVTVTADYCTEQIRVELGGIGFDLALDETNSRAFVSVPSLTTVLEVDLTTFTVTNTRRTSGPPYGIDLAADGNTLYVALSDIGSLGYVDTATGVEQVVDIAVLLDHMSAYDVAEVTPNRIVVSASPSSGGFAYIVEVRRDLANAAQRVASDRIIRAQPSFAVSPDNAAVFVGEGFSPNSIYKLDATQATMPIVLEDEHGSVSGARHLSLNAEGSRIYTAAGQIFGTDSLTQVGQLAPGISIVAADGSVVYVADGDPETIGIYDAQLLNRIGELHSGCQLLQVAHLAELAEGGLLVLGDDLLCGQRIVAY